MSKRRILVVDDDPSFLEILRYTVEDAGHNAVCVESGDAALRQLRETPADVLVTDLRMPGMSGEDLILAVHEWLPDLPILVVTAHADVETAVHVMQRGASDVVTKPLQRDLFKHRLETLLRQTTLEAENAELRDKLDTLQAPHAFVATSPVMLGLLDQARRIATSEATVLIQGQSGTGKELFARTLHEMSPRATKPFVAVNCAAIPAELLESELFGHTKGAFTGATQARQGKFLQANGGTFFLDEIGALPEPLQAKLLRALQEREVDLVGGSQPVPIDVRVLAATNTRLEQAVAEGQFREDLFYRLNVIALELPTLAERREDIVPLLRRFLGELGVAEITLEPDAERCLLEYAWPGNVRELQNLCQRLVLLRAQSDRIQWADLPENIQQNRVLQPEDRIVIHVGADGLQMDNVERELLLYGLRRMEWNQTRAAEFLGISRQTLIYRMGKFQLTPPSAGSRELEHAGSESEQR